MTNPDERVRGGVPFWVSLALAVVVVVSTLTVASVHEAAVGEREIAAAKDAVRANDWPRAILHAKAAAQATAPLSPWPAQGEGVLRTIGHDAETRGDASTALHAYGALRAAALSTDAPGTSERWRREAEAGLARVASWERTDEGARTSAKIPEPSPADHAPRSGGSSGAATIDMREALAQSGMPSFWPFAALAASAFAFVGAGLWIAFGAPNVRGVRIAQSILALAVVTSGAVLLAN